MQHYRIFLYDTDKINKHPKNEVVYRDEPFYRWKFEGDLVKMYNVIIGLGPFPNIECPEKDFGACSIDQMEKIIRNNFR